MQAERSHLDMWHIRIKNALQQEEKRKESSGYNIEPYVKRKKRVKKCVNDKKHVYQKRKYVQLTLWDGEVKRRKRTQELHNTPEGTLQRGEIQRRLSRLVMKKRKRQSEIVLSGKKIKLKVKKMDIKKSASGGKRKRWQRSKKLERPKKYVRISDRRRSVRERLRTSGRDLRNDR